MICVMRQMPRRDPKFHQAEILEGVGKSISELLIIFRIGWCFRMLGAINFLVLWVDDIRIIKIDRVKVARYVLIRPVWRVVEILVALSCIDARPSGPIFLNHDRSIR